MPGRVACLVAALVCGACGAGASVDRGSASADEDHDRVPDARDGCPLVPEDVDGDRDEDGCPEGNDRQDTDRDVIIDRVDQCPGDAEDRDDFQDEDGCPEPDNDQDRIPDTDDQCPSEAEVYNGLDDDDGCPDNATVHVMVTGAPIIDRVYFRRGSSTVPVVAGPIVEAIAATLVGNPQLERIGLVGRATRDEPRARSLAADRALSVARELVAHGVARARLSLYAEVVTVPRAEHERTRHVQPYVLRTEGQDADVPDLARAAPIPFEP